MKQAHKNTDKKYLSWSLLRDYFSNILSNTEMHDTELSAMRDPFNVDAFDGLASHAPASLNNDIQTLNIRIERKTGSLSSSKKIKITPKWIVTAILIIIAASTILLLTKNHRTAELERTDLKQNSPFTELAETINKPLLTEHQAKDTLLAKQIKRSDNVISKQIQSPVNKTINDKAKNIDSSLLLTQLKPKSADLISANKNVEIQTLTISPKKENKNTIAQGINKPKATLSDELPNRLPDSADRTKNEVIDLQKESAVAAMPKIVYANYIKNIKLAFLEDNTDIIGDFEASFTIDRNGKLDNFSIIKSIGRRNDKKLVRIIKDQESWNPAYLEGLSIESKSIIQISFP